MIRAILKLDCRVMTSYGKYLGLPRRQMTVVYTRVVVDEVIIHDGNLNISQQYNDRLYVG